MKRGDIQPEYWKYQLPGGYEVLAGKTDADNDILSLKLAAPGDLWFHVRGLPGSHVILRHPESRKPDSAAIRQAASIAAWHSKARNAGIVPVCYTESRHVGKPRGAKPGSVTLKREKIVKVRPALPDTSSCSGDDETSPRP
ncbi:MAG TPA: NFACT RNA binding domain-containing protein [Pontiella sp.]|nr:NFACT RNA binding domain-containing protein [Pontiella sp.]